MIALLQRVSEAAVHVNDDLQGEIITGRIGTGILALIGVEKGDTEVQADRLVDRILSYRVFEDEAGRMNLDVNQAGGALLLVPQFTLAANTRKGTRASFTSAAEPLIGNRLFERVVQRAATSGIETATGKFGAHMQVHLINDGPVTFWLQVPPPGVTD